MNKSNVLTIESKVTAKPTIKKTPKKIATLTTKKKATKKVVNPTGKSKAIVKAEETIKTLSAKKTKTSFEYQRLINASLKIEDKSLSKVYALVTKHSSTTVKGLVKEMLGTKLPTFATFREAVVKKYPQRQYFSVWQALGVLKGFSQSAKVADKVAKQGGKIEPKKASK